MSRVLVLGAGGMLGHKLIQHLAANHEVAGTMRTNTLADLPIFDDVRIIDGVDARDPETAHRAIEGHEADLVINCIGIVKQRQAATNPIPSITVNALFPHLVAEFAAKQDARLIHFSTDCVFSGRTGGYREDDEADALDLYGRTKFLGEVRHQEHVITLRTSIVGRELASFASLFEWFLAQEGAVGGYRNAIYSGVTTNWMAELVSRLIADFPTLHGLYQVAGPVIDKYELLTLVKEAFRRTTEIEPDDSVVIDRSLRGDRFTEETGIAAPSWREMVETMAADTTPYEEWR